MTASVGSDSGGSSSDPPGSEWPPPSVRTSSPKAGSWKPASTSKAPRAEPSAAATDAAAPPKAPDSTADADADAPSQPGPTSDATTSDGAVVDDAGAGAAGAPPGTPPNGGAVAATGGGGDDESSSGPSPSSSSSSGGGGLRGRVLRGSVLLMVASVAIRFSSFIAQLVLGALLLEEDFGLYAIALAFASIGTQLRSVLRPVLVEGMASASVEVDDLFRKLMWQLIAVSVLGAAWAPFMAQGLGKPELTVILAVLLLLMPLQMYPVYGMAVINHRMEFGRFGNVMLFGGALRHVATIIAAFAGAGVHSFTTGVVVAALTELVAVRFYKAKAPSLLPIPAPGWPTLRGGRSDGSVRRWLWPSAIALALAVYGDYLGATIAGASTVIVGLYFFGYQLAGAIFQPMNLAASTVLVPAFVRLEGVERRRAGFLKTIRATSLAGTLCFATAAVALAPLTDLLWNGKWNAAIFGIVGFAIYAPIRLIHPTAQAIARGCGQWNLYMSDMAITAVVTVATAFVGAMIGGLEALVIGVIAGHLLITLISTVRLGWYLEVGTLSSLAAALVPWLGGLIALGVAHIASPITGTELIGIPIRVAVFGGVALVTVVVPNLEIIAWISRDVRAKLFGSQGAKPAAA
ncbi:MAG: oligosaccharide flippase family protein [Actinomycetota bacterium]